MKIKISRKRWAKSGTWDLPGKPNCVGGYMMNACGFPMKQLVSPNFGPSIGPRPGLYGSHERFFYLAQEEICREHGLDLDFQEEAMKLNDNKDEKGLKKLFKSKGIELSFVP